MATNTERRGGLLAGLLPEPVEVAELFTDPLEVVLYPEELPAVEGAVAARRREFATVRHCARTALAGLGVAPGPIPPAGRGPSWAHRAPRWPDGIVGSMTHCDGYRAAAVARRTDVASVGVDAEPAAPLPPGVAELTTLPEERRLLAELAAAHPFLPWDRLLFSAKESVFKAWFPLTGRWLDFDQCLITPDPHRGSFTARLTVPGPVVSGTRVPHFHGRWSHSTTEDSPTGHLATAVLVPTHDGT